MLTRKHSIPFSCYTFKNLYFFLCVIVYWCKSLFLVPHFSVVEWDSVYLVTLCFGGMVLRMSVSFLSVLVECISLSFPSVPIERARSGGWRRPAPTDQSLPVHVPRGEQQGGAGHQEQPPVHGETAHTDHRGPRPRQAQGSVPNTCTYRRRLYE